MGDFASENDLLLKAAGVADVGGYFRSNDFEGDIGILKELILHFVDLAHATASDEANDEKAIRDELGWLETRCARRRSRGSQAACGGDAVRSEQWLREKAA